MAAVVPPAAKELLIAGIALKPEVEIERQHRLEALKAQLLSMATRAPPYQARSLISDIGAPTRLDDTQSVKAN